LLDVFPVFYKSFRPYPFTMLFLLGRICCALGDVVIGSLSSIRNIADLS